ncbi:hypothetical protein CPLU01_13062 [Colletotrichum plurivorum]|uniref:Uncharacterized protein n=1 Tax=Colletotrichum plurivorum TaxID=2175906 RepID=A0A8H6N4P9_9PEZI|nr:hypothetical protein CPLU01_13062 [Colletotrichum plurivorum]
MLNLAAPSSTLLKSFRWSEWGQQYCALSGAAAAILVMVILLSEFNHQPFFEWNGISLNTIISILSVTGKAAITFTISECVAQWKWILFDREERLLIDFDRIDGATRGPLGSLRVILKTKGAYVVQFGAVLTLLTIGLDPFAQQLIQLDQDTRYNGPAHDTFARISRSTNYSLGISTALLDGYTSSGGSRKLEKWGLRTSIPPSMEGAIMAAFYKSIEDLRRETLYQCSSGDCKFDGFQTLGICHRCSDVTSQLVNRTGDFADIMNAIDGIKFLSLNDEIRHDNAFYLPNGHFIANLNGWHPFAKSAWTLISTTFGTGNPNKTVSMKNLDTILWSMSFIYPDFESLKQNYGDNIAAATWPTFNLDASECALYYCLKNITSEVKGSELTENITEVTGVTRSPGSWNEGESYTTWDTDPSDPRNSPEFHAPADEARSLEFHKMWSVDSYNSLGLHDPSQGLRSAEIQEVSIKSLSAHFQAMFRWEAWFNNTVIRESLRGIPGMEGAVGFNGLIAQIERESRPPTLGRLFPWSKMNHGNITSTFERMALSMTNQMRRTSQPEDEARNGMGTMTYTGLVGSPVVLYRAVWPWIALHVTSLVCASIFLLLTVYSSNGKEGTPLWKNSSLAAVRRGDEMGGLLSSAGPSVRDMEDIARKTYVGEGLNVVEEAKPWIAETVEPGTKPRMQSRTF